MQAARCRFARFEHRARAPILDRGGLLRVEHPPAFGVLPDDRPHERERMTECDPRLLERTRDDQHQPPRLRPRTRHRRCAKRARERRFTGTARYGQPHRTPPGSFEPIYPFPLPRHERQRSAGTFTLRYRQGFEPRYHRVRPRLFVQIRVDLRRLLGPPLRTIAAHVRRAVTFPFRG